MSTLYVSEQGATLRCQGQRLIVKKEKETLLSVPLHRLERVVLMGRIQMTADATGRLLDQNVPLLMLNQCGKMRGSLIPPLDPNVTVRRRQYALATDSNYRNAFATAIARAKILNCRTVLRRYSYNHPSKILKKHISHINGLYTTLHKTYPVASVMGMEGMATRHYFAGLTEILKELDVGFKGRTRRPPTDPVNATLSFAYVLLTHHLISLIQSHGLDPYLGFLHKPNRNAPALALDLLEEFRQPFVDRFVLSIFNKGMLKSADFEKLSTNGIFLKPDARSCFLRRWDDWLNYPQSVSSSAGKTSVLSVIRTQVENCRRAFVQEKSYTPFTL